MPTKPPEQVIFCENQEVLSTLVQTGYAFSVLADFPQLRTPDLCYIPVEGFSPLSFGVSYLRWGPQPDPAAVPGHFGADGDSCPRPRHLI